MFSVIAATLLIAQCAFAAPVTNTAAATVGKIRGVQSPIYHLYLQANPKNGIRYSNDVLSPHSTDQNM